MATGKKTGRKREEAGDWIHLRRTKVECVLGVHPAEREQKRVVWVDLSLECDTRPAAATDELNDALNYEVIEAAVVALAKKARFRLVESLAALVAETCLGYPGVRRVRVVVEKPHALPLTESVETDAIAEGEFASGYMECVRADAPGGFRIKPGLQAAGARLAVDGERLAQPGNRGHAARAV